MSRIAYSEPDSARFGAEIYRVQIADLAGAQAADAEARAAGAELLILRCPVEQIAAVQHLESQGFILCDTLVTYAGDTARFRESPADAGTELRPYSGDQRDALARAARSCFSEFSGHYHTDPRLDPAQATEVYVDQCMLATEDAAGFVALSFTDGALSGFITGTRETPQRGRVVLNAVLPAFRGRGIYGLVFREAGHRFAREGVAELVIGTQLSNLAPPRVWVKHGLAFREAAYTLHRWYR